ncbi:MAG: PIG-L deacetylase family protein [Actinomycetota bacterium]
MTCRPRTFRRAVLALALLIAALSNWRQLHAREAPAAAERLPATRVPSAGERVLVFAPHPDDEVLALGGLLQQSRQRGAQVQVVYLTSGDGFRLCAAARYRGWPSQKRMRQLARVRQAEAREALSRLGIGPASATFLGYPDRGLSSLWLSHWTADQPYRSPYTAENRVASPTDSRRGAPFCGESVIRDIDQALAEHRPDFVFYPDSTDDHPDHWAAHCLIELALERRGLAGRAPIMQRRTYLIHRGEWPSPMRAEPSLALSPPAELRGRGARWEQAPLTPAAVAAKANALAAYRSQQALAGNFLSAFVRRNELITYWRNADRGFPVARSSAPDSGDFVVGASAFFSPHPEPDTRVIWDSTRDRFARARFGSVPPQWRWNRNKTPSGSPLAFGSQLPPGQRMSCTGSQ